MKAFVTGGTGFLGAHVVRQLLDQGAKVNALARKTSNLRNLEGLDISIIEGNLCNSKEWKSALEGCDTVFHIAADYRLWVPNPEDMYRSNVEGTRQVIEAAIKTGAKRIIHTSTVGALAYPEKGQVSDETCEPFETDLIGPYKKSKRQGELVAREFAAQGHPIIIVNPSTPIGPLDSKPTPTGKMLVDYLNGKMFGYLNTGLNLIDVRDCAMGHLLAAEKGVVGERYILGNRNISMKEIFEIVGKVKGKKLPRFQVPYPIAFMYGLVDTFISDHITHRPPLAPLVGVKMAAHTMYFDPSKAINELGLPQNPIETALADAVNWFEANGYIK